MSSSSSSAVPDLPNGAAAQSSSGSEAAVSVGAKRPRSDEKDEVVKGVFETAGFKNHVKTEEEMANLFTSAVESHPFVNRSHYNAIIDTDTVVRDTKGNVVCVLLKDSLPKKVSEMAADVLRGAPSRTSLRSSIFGGESPLSGIAGYYDYSGSPVELKCRKTSFTFEHVKTWPAVFPMISYVSQLYKEACPTEWQRQNEAIPDVVRLRDSPFSTLTINQRFRTARHTDAGDFDDGMGVLAVMEGNFEGLHLGMPDFGICFRMQPRDVLLFDTHHFHCNTELELPFKNSDWDRLTCVFYYRTQLGESNCMSNYRRRLEEAMESGNHDIQITKIEPTDNGINSNVPSPIHRATNTPFGIAASMCVFCNVRGPLEQLHKLLVNDPCRYLDMFGEKSIDGTGLPQRTDSELVSMLKQVRSEGRVSELGGFSDTAVSQESMDMKKGLLSVKNLSQVLPPQLCAMYEESKEAWLAEVHRSWKHQIKLSPNREDFSWSNQGPINKSFFDLCDVAQQVMIFLLGNDHPSKSEEAAFWFCFATSMHDLTLQAPLNMPSTAMSMRKLNVKLKDYSFGGTRYFKDQSDEEQQKRILRKKRIIEARKAGDADEEEVTTNWLVNDEYDYQEEDTPVDYEALGVLPADQNPSLAHARQARELMGAAGAKGVVKTEEVNDDSNQEGEEKKSKGGLPSILHVVPDADPHFYRKLLVLVKEFCATLDENENLKKEADRLLVGCKTTQLWGKVAMMKCGGLSTGDDDLISSTLSISDFCRLFTKLAEKEENGTIGASAAVGEKAESELEVKLADVGMVEETVLSLSEALKLMTSSSSSSSSQPAPLYDVVILHHVLSTHQPLTTQPHPILDLVRDVVVPLSRLSRSATMVLESDTRDANHSLLIPLIDVPFTRAVGPALNIATGLKAAGGIVPKPSIVQTLRCSNMSEDRTVTTNWVSADELKVAMGGGLPVGEDGLKRVAGASTLIAAITTSHPPPADLRYLGTTQFKRSPLQTVCHIVTTIKE